jgi:hypothetical protein
VHKAAWLKADKSFAEGVKAHVHKPLCALLNALIAGNADEKAQAALWGRMWCLPVVDIAHHATPRQGPAHLVVSLAIFYIHSSQEPTMRKRVFLKQKSKANAPLTTLG